VRVVSLDTGSAASIQELAQLIKTDYDQKIDLLVRGSSSVPRGSSTAAVAPAAAVPAPARLALQEDQADAHRIWPML
jgi:hypothetical protein